MTLAEVIKRAQEQWRALVYSPTPTEIPGDEEDYIAAAVAAHLASDEVVERMARAMCEEQGLDWDAQADAMRSGSGSDEEQDGFRELARAAIRAAVSGGGDG